MDVPAVMEELAGKVRAALAELEVYARPERKPEVPAIIFGFPEVDYDQTGGRGEDLIRGALVVIVGQVDDGETGEKLLRYANGSGSSSVKAALEAKPHATFWTISVSHAEPDELTFNNINYAALIFDFELTGQGSG